MRNGKSVLGMNLRRRAGILQKLFRQGTELHKWYNPVTFSAFYRSIQDRKREAQCPIR